MQHHSYNLIYIAGIVSCTMKFAPFPIHQVTVKEHRAIYLKGYYIFTYIKNN